MLVLDANILIRAALGSRAEQIEFVAPDIAFEAVQKHLPTILAKRQIQIPLR